MVTLINFDFSKQTIQFYRTVLAIAGDNAVEDEIIDSNFFAGDKIFVVAAFSIRLILLSVNR
jgi:hypothetical protein